MSAAVSPLLSSSRRAYALSTTVVTNPEARPRVFGSGTASRTPDEPAATPTSPGPLRRQAVGSRAAAPAGGGPPATTAGSAPGRLPTFLGKLPGQLPDR